MVESMRKLLRLSLIEMMAILMVLMVGCASNSTDVDDDEPDDTTPPATVTDLRIVAATPVSLTLEWTAPGDDDTAGYAMSYDLRGSLETITEANFEDAVQIEPDNPPLPPGVTEVMILDELDPGETYYFALKTVDDAGNVSGLSNCAHGTCLQEQIINVPDPALNQLIRESVSRPTGDIRLSDILKLIELEGNEKGIADLTGLEYAANLKLANLMDNMITDPSPLGGLTRIEQINLGINQVSDISSLQNLTSLLHFSCAQNLVTDISAISVMKRLRVLSVHYNPDLTDLSPIGDLDSLTVLSISNLGQTDLSYIAGMTSLQELYAGGNPLNDISELADMPNLHSVYLAYCQIANLTPLVNNSDFADGDELDVRGNPLSQAAINQQIPELQARGVTVTY